MKLVAIKALAGFNYVRPDGVLAIGATDPTKCMIYMAGGVAIPARCPIATTDASPTAMAI